MKGARDNKKTQGVLTGSDRKGELRKKRKVAGWGPEMTAQSELDESAEGSVYMNGSGSPLPLR